MGWRASAAGLLLVSSSAWAQSYELQQNTAQFASIRPAAACLTFADDDDAYVRLASPFGFEFFGAPIAAGTMLDISTNGFVGIDIEDDALTRGNTALPDLQRPNGIFAAFWDDLRVGCVAQTVSGLPPDRELIVEWEDAQFANMASDSAAFQLRIRERDGVIAMHFGPRSGTSLGMWTGTIGLENRAGTEGYQHTCLAVSPFCPFDRVPEGTLLRFVPTSTPSADAGVADSGAGEDAGSADSMSMNSDAGTAGEDATAGADAAAPGADAAGADAAAPGADAASADAAPRSADAADVAADESSCGCHATKGGAPKIWPFLALLTALAAGRPRLRRRN